MKRITASLSVHIQATATCQMLRGRVYRHLEMIADMETILERHPDTTASRDYFAAKQQLADAAALLAQELAQELAR